MQVTSIILNYNGMKVLPAAVQSLEQQTFRPFNLWITDNHSGDDSPAWIRDHHPGITLVEHRENLGWSGAYNAVLKQLLPSASEWFWLLNNDVIVPPGCLEAMLQFAGDHPECRILSPLIRYNDPRDRMWFCGGRIDPESFTVGHCDSLEQFRRLPDTRRYISGCAMLVHRSVFESVGLFDEKLFMYCEDADFCHRAARAGFRMDMVESAELYHVVRNASGGADRLTPFLVYHTLRSVMRLWRKHAGWRRFHFGFCRHHMGKWMNQIDAWSADPSDRELAESLVDAVWYYFLPLASPRSWPKSPSWFRRVLLRRPWLAAQLMGFQWPGRSEA